MTEEEYFEWLLDSGALVVIGHDDGEPLFALSREAKDIAPDFYQAWLAKQSAVVTRLWQKDVIDLVWTNSDVFMTLNEQAFFNGSLDGLDDEELEVLADIINEFVRRLESMERSEEFEGPV